MTVTRKALTSIETCFSAKFPGANIRVVMEKLNSSNIINLSQFYDNTYVAFTNFPYLACFYILGVSPNFKTLDSV